MRKRLFVLGPLALIGLFVIIAVGGEVVQQLWNWLLPPLFGWPQITFWQALGLLALCRILFGGYGGYHPRTHISRRMAARWEQMTPEERERMRGRCGFGPRTSASDAT